MGAGGQRVREQRSWLPTATPLHEGKVVYHSQSLYTWVTPAPQLTYKLIDDTNTTTNISHTRINSLCSSLPLTSPLPAPPSPPSAACRLMIEGSDHRFCLKPCTTHLVRPDVLNLTGTLERDGMDIQHKKV